VTVGKRGRVVVQINHDQCSGTAHCQQSMPHVFVLINRKSTIRPDVNWDAVDLDALQHTVDACPWFAISVDIEGA
jgi:ferredoxin